MLINRKQIDKKQNAHFVKYKSKYWYFNSQLLRIGANVLKE